MKRSVPTYSELYTISDLHLGGSPGMQMFCQGLRLQAFIESLADKKNGKLTLVIAGDIIDSLPYLNTPGTYIAVDGAANLLSTVMTDGAFSPVFAGLKTLLKNEDAELILLIGNHDLELALPEAQEQLLEVIAPSYSARGRVRFLMYGTGFRCQVGQRTVFITHGNEADLWNHVDHEALRKAAHTRTLGKAFDPKAWEPNAGTKLVVDIMNNIKRNYPFIDLLKPEMGAAVKILSILDGDAVKSFYDALPAFAKAAKASTGSYVVLGNGELVQPQPELIRLLGEAMPKPESKPNAISSSNSISQRVSQFQNENKRPEDLVSDSDATLGYFGYGWDRFWGASEAEALRRALQDWIKDDQSFRLDYPDDVFKGVMSLVGYPDRL